MKIRHRLPTVAILPMLALVGGGGLTSADPPGCTVPLRFNMRGSQ